ncbi:MAG: GNAT family N-acetyltransferase [Pyrinomonadaceae bacterium]
MIEPTEELAAALHAMAEEYQAAGDDRYKLALEDFHAYFRSLVKYAKGVNLPSGHVPSSTFWLVSGGGRVIGRSSLRHQLTTELAHEGGHIGYDIRPSERRKGYGTLILKLTLERAREKGLRRVFITCDADNVGSAKVIEKNGGGLRGQEVSHRTGKLISQYWIEL